MIDRYRFAQELSWDKPDEKSQSYGVLSIRSLLPEPQTIVLVWESILSAELQVKVFRGGELLQELSWTQARWQIPQRLWFHSPSHQLELQPSDTLHIHYHWQQSLAQPRSLLVMTESIAREQSLRSLLLSLLILLSYGMTILLLLSLAWYRREKFLSILALFLFASLGLCLEFRLRQSLSQGLALWLPMPLPLCLWGFFYKLCLWLIYRRLSYGLARPWQNRIHFALLFSFTGLCLFGLAQDEQGALRVLTLQFWLAAIYGGYLATISFRRRHLHRWDLAILSASLGLTSILLFFSIAWPLLPLAIDNYLLIGTFLQVSYLCWQYFIRKERTYPKSVASESQPSLREDKDRRINLEQGQWLHAEKMAALGTFTNGLANELNNPLAIISGHRFRLSSMIESRSFNIQDLEKSLFKIEQSVNRAIEIIEALKVYAHDSSLSEEGSQSFLIKETIKYTLDLCRDKVLGKGIKLSIADVPDLKVEGKQGQLIQVLLILIDNAIDALYRSSEKRISIEFETVSHALRILVYDTGEGVPSEIRSQIFDPFFTTKDQFRHKGLGLSLAAGILQSFKGRIYLDESHPQTCFVLELRYSRQDISSPPISGLEKLPAK